MHNPSTLNLILGHNQGLQHTNTDSFTWEVGDFFLSATILHPIKIKVGLPNKYFRHAFIFKTLKKILASQCDSTLQGDDFIRNLKCGKI